MKPLLALGIALFALLLPSGARGQQGDYGVRIPAKVQGWYAPVGSRLIGSDEKDHIRRGSVNAWDWSASIGSPVWAIGPGVVNYAGCNNSGGYGCWVRIDHGSGYESSTAHCKEGSVRVQSGQQVDAKTQICNVGMTGMTSWPHVHLVIKYKGKHQLISNFFDVNLIHYCFFTKCKATNDPQAPVTLGGQVITQQGQQQTQAVQAESRGMKLLRSIASLPAEDFGKLIALVALGIMFVWWLSGVYVRVVITTALTAMIVAGGMLYLFMPPIAAAAPTAAGQQSAMVGGTWEQAYQIVQGNEGWKCTNDGAYTMGGVTQGTYNRWRAKHGLGPADVCRNLTRDQAKAVFYELFWLPVGADKMPWPLALTVVDHYYNTGKVSHLLAQCGQDVACFNGARIVDYRSKKNCNLYCAGWINRVNKIRKYTGG